MTLSKIIQTLTRHVARSRIGRRRTGPTPVDDRGSHPGDRPVAATHKVDETVIYHINRALDRAMELGLYDHADRIIRSAQQLGENITPQLTERIARLHLIRNRPDAALHAIETAHEQTNSLRMLRIVCQVLTGNRLDAHIELHRWSHNNTCPLEARCLLALLDMEQGLIEDAHRALQQNVRQLADPQTIELMVLLAASRGRNDLAIRWCEHLIYTVQSRESTISPRLFAESLELPMRESITITSRDVESLASELLVNEPLIPALTTAQELEPEPAVAGLLYRAVEYALSEFTQRDAALESLVRLSLVLENREQAVQWTEQAIDENRITATIARLARNLIDGEHTPHTPKTAHERTGQAVIGRLSDADSGTDDQRQWKRAA